MTSKHSQTPVLISQGVFDSINTFREFEQRVSALFATNTKVQGDAFEIFVEAYLATQPIQQCQETWLVGDISVEIREALNLPNDSKGIDGVYKSMMGGYVPYQVKFRSNRPALGFNEVASFLGITERATDRLLITNCDTIAIDIKNRTGVRSLRGVDFDQLTVEDFVAIENWLKQKPEKRKSLTPDPYQVDALTNIANHLKTNTRGTVVMACGTGKTLVALWAVTQIKANTILVLVPSLTLLQQTLEEWSIHNSWGSDFSYLCVCSDPSVNLKNDEIQIDHADVPFRVDTNPEIIKSYLNQNNGKKKIVFSTYQSSLVVSQATKGEFEFDFAVFDEAHKTTGSTNGRFAHALKDENIQIKKRLFLTATPKIYDITKRDKDGELKFVSMNNSAVYGTRAHTLTFGEAAEKGVICPYKVIITLIDKQQVDDFVLKNGITMIEGDFVTARWVANQIAISSAIKHTKAKKIITFHSRVKTAQDFASDEVYGIKKFIDNFNVFHVHGKQKSSERKDIISKFKNAEKSLITNAKCLTEGVDVPAVDLIAFIDPRHSKIDIAQAVGRAMRKPRKSNKEVGYVVVPIFADKNNRETINEAIKSEKFDDVALVLNALLEQDEELVEIVKELKQSSGFGGSFNPVKLDPKIEVIGPLVDLDELKNNILLEIVERLGESWDEWYGRLERFKKDNGHVNVPGKFINNGFGLGSWVAHQRRAQEKLEHSRRYRLDAIGFSWDPLEDQWEEAFEKLLNFKAKKGHCNVPHKFKVDSFSLGQWVHVQRRNKKKLSANRRTDLEKIGFEWDSLHIKNWENGFIALQKFKAEKGHCLVPVLFDQDEFHLGNWVTTQRQQKNALSKDKIKRLSRIGFIWDALDNQWEKGFNALKNYKNREGHFRIARDYIEDGITLKSWAQYQKKNKGILSIERVKLLDKLGFIWDPLDEAWENNFDLLKRYKLREGHCLVNIKHIEASINIGHWVSNQRKKWDKLSDTRKLRLQGIGFVVNPLSNQWELGYIALKNFKKRVGHCIVPSRHIENGYKLGTWVGSQRINKEQITYERVNRLNELGFVWDALSEKWEEGFLALSNFNKKFGHVRPSPSHIENGFKLGSWVAYQRKNKERLTEDYRLRLDQLGFIWNPYMDQWENNFIALVHFKSREGHCRVPSGHKENGSALGSWVSTQRKEKSNLQDENLQRLNKIGFIWDPTSQQWNMRFDTLLAFNARQGHCRVPSDHIEDNFKLGQWVRVQRKRKEKLSEDCITRLNKIRFIWNINENQFSLLTEDNAVESKAPF